MSSSRKQFRHSVDKNASQLTPLASIAAYIGEESIRVLNVSVGGIALLFEREKDFQEGDLVELSLSIRERAFPVTLEVKAKMGLRFSCQFVDLTPACRTALDGFMAPKAIGDSFQLDAALSNNPEALALVDEASHYYSFVGSDDNLSLVWTSSNDLLLKLLLIKQSKVLEWTKQCGLRTGTINSSVSDEPKFHETADPMIAHYFADVLLSWINPEHAPRFVQKILNKEIKGSDLEFSLKIL